MINITQDLAQQIGELLASYRRRCRLTQSELANRLGLSSKSGTVSISHLENGKFKNLSLDLILNYLTVCEIPWASFFEQLAGSYFNKRHKRVMAQVPTSKLFKKVDRDVAKYTHSIDTKFSRKQGIKPIEPKQKEQMSVEFGKYRAVIEDIEREVTLLLGNSCEPYLLNQYYKGFAREVYRTLRKILSAETTTSLKGDLRSLVVNEKLTQIIEKWIKKGLKRTTLEQIKEIPIRHLSITDKQDN